VNLSANKQHRSKYSHTSILNGYRDIKPQRLWGQEFDLLGSRDAISHVTISLAICSFLQVVNYVYLARLRRYGAWNIWGTTL